jgi:hypothetical protein
LMNDRSQLFHIPILTSSHSDFKPIKR